MDFTSHGDKPRTPVKIVLLGLKAKMLERLKGKNGVYYLWGADGKYLEVFIPYDVHKRRTTTLLTDLDRLAEYGAGHVTP